MRSLYRYLSMAVAAAVLVQASAIAFGVFGIAHDVDAGTVVDKNYEENFGLTLHAIMGTTVIPLLALALLIVGILVRSVDGALRWASVIFGLVLLQVVLAMVSFGAPVVGLLHGANAILILLSSVKAVSVMPRQRAQLVA
ncbi:MAG: hypothetical protein WAN48_03625 [Actinomycetes bacterium]